MTTLMLEEALSAPDTVAQQLAQDESAYARLGESLRTQPPSS